jgi:phosphopantetheine adenylyltransferase
MGNSLAKNLTNKKKFKDFNERLTDLERNLPAFGQAFQQIAEGLNRKVEAVREVLDAVSAILGTEAVGQKINEKRVADSKALIELGLAEGQLVKADTITANGLVVATQYNKDGSVAIERIQQLVDKLAPEVIQDIVDKTVPYRYVGPEADLEVQEFYLPAPPPAAPVDDNGQPTEQQAPAEDGNMDQQAPESQG